MACSGVLHSFPGTRISVRPILIPGLPVLPAVNVSLRLRRCATAVSPRCRSGVAAAQNCEKSKSLPRRVRRSGLKHDMLHANANATVLKFSSNSLSASRIPKHKILAAHVARANSQKNHHLAQLRQRCANAATPLRRSCDFGCACCAEAAQHV